MSNKFYQDQKALTYDDVLLVPNFNPIESRTDVDLGITLGKHCALDVPIMSAAMCTVTEAAMCRAMGKAGGMGIVHRFQKLEARRVQALSEANNVGIAIGLTDNIEEVQHTPAWMMLCIDVAHAHARAVGSYLRELRAACPHHTIMVGNVVTPEAVEYFEDLGADIIKVGIGGGSICSTRDVTGFGFPNLSALLNITTKARVPIVADGGIRSSGDIAKALAAGASAVMVGSLLAGCDEAPGSVMELNGRMVKVYRGQASESAQVDYKGGLKKNTVAEGVSGFVPCKGSAEDVINSLAGGLRSAFTYAGASTLVEFQEKTKFVRVSTHTIASESKTRI